MMLLHQLRNRGREVLWLGLTEIDAMQSLLCLESASQGTRCVLGRQPEDVAERGAVERHQWTLIDGRGHEYRLAASRDPETCAQPVELGCGRGSHAHQLDLVQDPAAVCVQQSERD